MKDKLKEQCKKYILDKSQSGAYDLAGNIEEETNDLFNFINQNYIPRKEVDGLKMKIGKFIPVKSILFEEEHNEYNKAVKLGWDNAICRINQKINDLLKK